MQCMYEVVKTIVSITLPLKKNKSKLDNTDESKTNIKLHIHNNTINVQDKGNIPKKFTLSKQNNNEIKTTKNKNKEKYSERTSTSFLGRTYDYHYVNSNNSKPSLACPALRCTCGLFFNFFDHYDDGIKKIY